jgi:hypothetical protein
VQTSKTVITRADHLNPAYEVRRFRRTSIVADRVLRLLGVASTIPDFLERARDFRSPEAHIGTERGAGEKDQHRTPSDRTKRATAVTATVIPPTRYCGNALCVKCLVNRSPRHIRLRCTFVTSS